MKLLRKLVAWTAGLARTPYATAEAIAADGDPGPGVLLFLLLTACVAFLHGGTMAGAYGGWAFDIVQILRQIGLDTLGLVVGATGVYLVIKFFGGEAGWTGVLAFWSFSFLPTALFFGGGLLGLILFWRIYGSPNAIPEPVILLGFFFAALMALWKFWLLLTALRVVGNLTLAGVVKSCVFLGVGLFLYWWAMLALGWQSIPYV